MSRLVLASCSFALVFACARLSSAQSTQRILVLETAETHALAARTGMEFQASGFLVEVQTASSDTHDSHALELRAQRAQAFATLELRARPDAVEVWVWERATRKLVMRDLVTQTHDTAETALRVVEVLRASLLEAEHRPALTPVEPLPPVARQIVVAQPPRWRGALELGITSFGSLGGVPVSVHAFAGASVVYANRVRVSLALDVPLTASTLREAEGEGVVRWVSAAMFVSAHTLPSHSLFDIRPGVGAGLVWLSSFGTPAPGYTGASTQGTTGSAWARVQATWSPNAHVSLWIDGRVGVAFSLQRFVFAGREIATWGYPLLAASAGVSVQWP